MPISTACPSCQQRLKLADTLVGKRVRCPKCQQVFLVPPGQEQLVQRPIKPAGQPARPTEVPSDSSDHDDRRDTDGAARRKRKLASRQNTQSFYWAIGAGRVSWC
jgi:Zn-finger nucleic acid-binding protein